MLQVVGDDPGSGGETGLDPGFGGQSQLDSPLGHEPGADHDRWIRGVGAAGDGRDDHGPVLQQVAFTVDVDGHACRGLRYGLAGASTLGHPARIARLGDLVPLGRGRGRHQVLQAHGKIALQIGHGHSVLRPPRTGQTRFERGDVQFEGGGELGVRRGVAAEQSLFLAIPFDPIHDLGRPAGALQVAHGFLVDGEEAHGGSVLRRHVGDGGPIGQRQVGQPGAVEFHELLDYAVAPEEFGHPEDEVGGGGADRQLSHQLHADHLGDQHEVRLAQHDRFGLDAAYSPAHDSQAVDHGGV